MIDGRENGQLILLRSREQDTSGTFVSGPQYDKNAGSVPPDVWKELREALQMHRIRVSALLLRIEERIAAESGEGC